jgi:hypothetical protein
MSWIKKELKRRARTPEAEPELAAASAQPGTGGEQAVLAIQALWQRLEAANEALPTELKLRREPVAQAPRQGPRFQVWLRAPNGAAIGHAGDALRYVWPGSPARRSSNFWIGWDAQAGQLELRQRVSPLPSPVIARHRFDEGRAELIVKQLVLGKKVSVRALRKKRLWLF